MRKWLYLTVLALALVSLALGGWAVQAARAAVRHARTAAPAGTRERAPRARTHTRRREQ